MNISAKYNSKEVEEKILAFWLKNNIFSSKVNLQKPSFCIVIPPPNITGILHMGHALNNTIQDVLTRYYRLKGYEALWVPGVDHAGIATQNMVEKDLAKEGKKKEDIGKEEFIKRLWKWKEQYGSTIIEQLKRLGASCDWQRLRFTLDEGYSEAVREVFVSLYHKGLIYRGSYIINWCPRCKTALSDEEAPHKETDGWLYYIRYPVILGKNSQNHSQNPYIVVATTRPETMLGDTAVAVNPADARYRYLKEAKVILPILKRELKIIEDEVVDREFGTGVVKVTPAHDKTDFFLAKRHNLEFINIMDEEGVLNENAGQFKGKERFLARKQIVRTLEKEGLLEKKEPYKVSAGRCYRCDTIVEPRLCPQWFVKMKPLAKEAIKVVEEGKIKFYPDRWKKVYLNWMRNIQDWCISRQIWWGHRIPVWYCKVCQKKNNEESEFSEKADTRGIIVSKTSPSQCPCCGSKELVQDEDVLDTWFSSWLWPFAVFGWPKKEACEELNYFYPTNVLVTASEIIFFWVARMIMSSLEFTRQIPFSDVIVHGTVRDSKGVKMSKSLGNIIDPLEIIDKFGADALRFSLIMLASSGCDVYLSAEKFLLGRNFVNKLWNATRFILNKVEDRKIKDFKSINIKAPEEWIFSHYNKTLEEVELHFTHYNFNDAAKVIYNFFWHIYCDWYIEISKYNFDDDKASVLIHLLLKTIKILHPFIPFVTEEIFQMFKIKTNLSLEQSLAISSWPEKFTLKENRSFEIERLVETIKAIRNAKTLLGFGGKIFPLEVKTPSDKLWKENLSWIKKLSFSSEIKFTQNLTCKIYTSSYWEVGFGFKGDFNWQVFKKNLDKKLKDLTHYFQELSRRLENEHFLSSAPQATIEKEKGKLSEVKSKISQINEVLSGIKV